MKRDNPYEAAFEAYLRGLRVGFVAVDEAKRAQLGGELESVKNADFIVVHGGAGGSARLVVDVKGRRFPGGSAERPRKVWQNWSAADDIAGLTLWAAHLGPDYRGVLAFAYQIEPPFTLPDGTPDRFEFRGKSYLMRGVAAADYKAAMRPRSPRWGTVHLPSADFRRLVRRRCGRAAPAGERSTCRAPTFADWCGRSRTSCGRRIRASRPRQRPE